MLRGTSPERGVTDREKGRAIPLIVNSQFWHCTKRVKLALKSPKQHGKTHLATGRNVTSKDPVGLRTTLDPRIRKEA